MIQREVARRICAPAGTADYGAFGIFVQWYAEPELLFDVPPSCFIPQPKVTSSVIRLDCRVSPPVEVKSEAMFMRVVRAAFAQRREERPTAPIVVAAAPQSMVMMPTTKTTIASPFFNRLTSR